MKVVTAAIIRDKDRFLIARRAPDQIHSGFWEFAGGKVEAGETPEECLARELKEEFGISATIGGFFADNVHSYPGGTILLKAYEVESFTGEIHTTVHDRVEWVTLESLRERELLPADIPIAAELKSLVQPSDVAG